MHRFQYIHLGISEAWDWAFFQVFLTCGGPAILEQTLFSMINPSFQKFSVKKIIKKSHLERFRFRTQSQHIQALHVER
jgi:hypothetical protein